MYGEEWEGASTSTKPGGKPKHRGRPEGVEYATHESVGYCPGMRCKGRTHAVRHRAQVSGALSIPKHYATRTDREWYGGHLLTALALKDVLQ